MGQPPVPSGSEPARRYRLAGARHAFVVLSAVIAGLWVGPGVSASNFGSIIYQTDPESGAWLANNRTHKIDLNNTTTQTGAAIQWAMENALEPTVINPTLVDDAVHDVQVLDGNFNNFLVAYVTCPPEAETTGSHPNRTCRGQRLRFNLQHMEDYTLQQRRSTACHELGHTVGLRHVADFDADTCMRVNISNRPATYREHDRTMIDSNY